jgi:hypothetical protein
MVKFTELFIHDCGKAMDIEAMLEYTDIFPGAYISELIIDTSKTYSLHGPSVNPIYTKLYNNTTKMITESIPKEIFGINLNTEMFFVYIVVEGLPTGYDESVYGPKTSLKSVVNLKPYYNKIIGTINSLDCKCADNNRFINAMLLLKGYEYALLSGDYYLASCLFKKFFGKSARAVKVGGCGCG